MMTSSDSHRLSAAATSTAASTTTTTTTSGKNIELNFALFNAVSNGRYRQTKLLVDAGASVNCTDEYGRTPLSICCLHVRDQRRQLRLLRLLVDSGADPNVRDNKGRTAIMHAATLGLTDAVTYLLEQNSINMELQDSDGNTVLMHAAASGHTEVVSVLLKQMGRLRQVLHLTQRNHHGYTALELAERNGHYEIVSTLGGTDRPPPLCHPGQLDRGPTPATPLPFPARWRMQFRRRRSGDDKDWPVVLGPNEDESRPSRSFPSLSRSKQGGEPEMDLNCSYSSTMSEPTQDLNRNLDVSNAEDGVDSNYHEVLNRLDLSIRRASPNRTNNNNRQQQQTVLGAENTLVTGQRPNRVSQVCHGRNYFPPIRPLNKECRTILAKHKDR